MSVAIYIVTEAEVPGVDAFVSGKAMGRVDSAALERVCTSAGVVPLMHYVSQDPADLEEFLEVDDLDDVEPASEAWFSAQEGLDLTLGLLRHLEQTPNALPNTNAVLEDLREYQAVFERLVERNVRWHFAIDY